MKKIFIYILLSLHVFFTGNIGVVLDDYFSTASAASTTVSYVGTATDLADSTQGWLTPNNAIGDTTGTAANMDIADRNVNTNTLALTNFNLSTAGLPASAIINGIQVDVEWEVENIRVRDSRVQLTIDGTTGVGNDYANNAAGPTAKSTTTYGGLADDWGAGLTSTDLLSANFGVLLQYVNTRNRDRFVYVYRVSMTIDYTIPTNPILSVTKIDNDADNSVTTNQVVRYTVTVENTGTDATGISLTDTIDTDFGTPYNFIYSSCGSPSQSFFDPTLTFSSIAVTGGASCIITYDLQVDAAAPGGNTITNSADASAATEGGNDPAAATADTLTVLTCGSTNDVSLEFNTDNWGYETFWSLTPTGNACGVGEIANGGNTAQVNCTSGGTQVATAGGYGNNTTTTEGPYSLTIGNSYNLHMVDDYGDGIDATPDVSILQNGAATDTFEVTGNGGVFTFTVAALPGCADTTSPNVTINQAPSQVDPTIVDSATFKVVFNEAINTGTFTAGDITLAGTTGSVTSGPTEISPNNGTSFEITVTGMTPSDIVIATIASGLIEDTAGNTNNTSTSSDNSVTYNGVISNPILSVTKIDDDVDNSVTTGQIIKYTITLSNTGVDGTGVSLTDIIDTDFGTPYNFTYSSCGSVTQSFSDPTLTFSSIDILGGSSCIITYDLQVDAAAPGGNTITNSADASAATEGGNDPAAATADALTVLACGVNDVSIDFQTDNWGYETFWSLTPTGNACGVGEVANGGNTAQVNCTSGGDQTATAGGYGNNTTTTEGPYSLTVGSSYDLHMVDDYGDGITVTPDVSVLQNGASTGTFEVVDNGGIYTFTVIEPLGCADTTSPNVTINQAPSQVDPTTVDSATFKVVFNEAINTGTFSSADITLTGTTGTVTSGPTQVSPNNDTSFEFTVTGMTSADTVTATIASGLIQDTSGNTNNTSNSSDNSVTYTGGDIIPPTIISTNFASGSLLPGGNHSIIINYSDADSGIDTSSASITLHKWDGVSVYGSDISGTGITLGSITTSIATYTTNNLTSGKYRYIFNISDIAGNPSTQTLDFYIDIPGFTISTPEIDLGILNIGSETFSPIVTVTVKTIGAGFDVTMNRSSSFIDGSEAIQSWDTISGYGYDQSPFSSSISAINTDESIASQGASLNTNGDKNTYTFDIQIGSLIDMQQAAGDYSGTLDFGINLTY